MYKTNFEIESIKDTKFDNIVRIYGKNENSKLIVDIFDKYFKLSIGNTIEMLFSDNIDQDLLNNYDMCMNGKVFKVNDIVSNISFGGLLMEINNIPNIRKDQKISCLINFH